MQRATVRNPGLGWADRAPRPTAPPTIPLSLPLRLASPVEKRPGSESPPSGGRDPDLPLGTVALFRGDALMAYGDWPVPSMILSDGAYGVGGFPGDPRSPEELVEWYRPHVAAWAERAHPATTLWFWNTEIGWAHVHPLLSDHGFEYVQTVVWDKGVAHIAGNVNGKTIRQFPVVTEVAVLYRRRPQFPTPDGVLSAQRWIRYEWRRAGLALHLANRACGVRNAASRKYLAQDWRWYWPPPEAMERLAAYANARGRPEGAPYFSLDGVTALTADTWASLRDRWNHLHGLTNVWSHPPLHGSERFKGSRMRSAPRVHRVGPSASVHLNQKPLEFMRRMLLATTEPGDVVWEPFGGLCSASVAAVELGRHACAAETVERFADLAAQRLEEVRMRSDQDLFRVSSA